MSKYYVATDGRTIFSTAEEESLPRNDFMNVAYVPFNFQELGFKSKDSLKIIIATEVQIHLEVIIKLFSPPYQTHISNAGCTRGCLEKFIFCFCFTTYMIWAPSTSTQHFYCLDHIHPDKVFLLHAKKYNYHLQFE